jgi:hypothetical protein
VRQAFSAAEARPASTSLSRLADSSCSSGMLGDSCNQIGARLGRVRGSAYAIFLHLCGPLHNCINSTGLAPEPCRDRLLICRGVAPSAEMAGRDELPNSGHVPSSGCAHEARQHQYLRHAHVADQTAVGDGDLDRQRTLTQSQRVHVGQRQRERCPPAPFSGTRVRMRRI